MLTGGWAGDGAGPRYHGHGYRVAGPAGPYRRPGHARRGLPSRAGSRVRPRRTGILSCRSAPLTPLVTPAASRSPRSPATSRNDSASFGAPGPPDRLLRRQPPACIVIDGVDRAESPAALYREVLRPLAAGPGRAVCGSCSDSTGRPAGGPALRSLARPRADRREFPPAQRKRDDVEQHVARTRRRRGCRLPGSTGRAPPRSASRRGCRMRTRRAAGQPRRRPRLGTGQSRPDPDLAAIDEAAATALRRGHVVPATVEAARQGTREDLRYTLEVHRSTRTGTGLPPRISRLGDLHDEAAPRALRRRPPSTLPPHGNSVQRYVAEINHRIDAEGRGARRRTVAKCNRPVCGAANRLPGFLLQMREPSAAGPARDPGRPTGQAEPARRSRAAEPAARGRNRRRGLNR